MKLRNYIVAAFTIASVWSGMSAHRNADDDSGIARRYSYLKTSDTSAVRSDSLKPKTPAQQRPKSSDSMKSRPVANTPQAERKVSHINIKSNFAYLKRGDEGTVYIFVGDVVGYHNGSLIICDSAIQHANINLVECFGNVIINKDSTYVYGDKAVYNDFTGIAQVFSPLIKMIDGDATLYTYNFIFDTYDNIGEFYGGGTMTRGETLLESDRGYYFADTKDFVCVDKAELRDSTYQIRSDSIGYNMNSDIATFYRKTFIWNQDGEILSAKEGQYFTAEDRYRFTSDAYIMTETRELWADDIDYYSLTNDAVLHRDIQIVDEEQKVMGFGDYGQYWGTPGNALLTENPSLLNFDPEQPDTLYMRADSIFLLVLDTLSPHHTIQRARQGEDIGGASKKKGVNQPPEGAIMSSPRTGEGGGLGSAAERTDMGIGTADSINETTIDIQKLRKAGVSQELLDELSGRGDLELVAEMTEEEIDAYADESGITVEDLRLLIDNIHFATESRSVTAGEIIDSLAQSGIAEDILAGAEIARESAEPDSEVPVNEAQESEEQSVTNIEESLPTAENGVDTSADKSKKDKKAERKSRKDRKNKNESVAVAGNNVAADEDSVQADEDQAVSVSAETGLPDSDEGIESEDSANAEEGEDGDVDENDEPIVRPDSGVEVQGEEKREEEVNIDELEQKVALGYHNVRIFRTDVQAVCDSLVGFSIDSTLHMYVKPIIWNEDTQITSDKAVFYTKNEQLDRAVFTGERPMAGQRLDYKHFNQLTAREITMFFRDNELYKINGDGNAETFYYGQDGEDKALTSFMTIESSNLTFMIEDSEIVTITYRVNPVFWMYPMDRIPADQSQIMNGFEWFGDLRPTKEDVFTRTVRPSQREAYMSMPTPNFPLTDKINEYRKALVSSGKWRDRTDKLSEEDQAYVDALRAQDGM